MITHSNMQLFLVKLLNKVFYHPAMVRWHRWTKVLLTSVCQNYPKFATKSSPAVHCYHTRWGARWEIKTQLISPDWGFTNNKKNLSCEKWFPGLLLSEKLFLTYLTLKLIRTRSNRQSPAPWQSMQMEFSLLKWPKLCAPKGVERLIRRDIKLTAK